MAFIEELIPLIETRCAGWVLPALAHSHTLAHAHAALAHSLPVTSSLLSSTCSCCPSSLIIRVSLYHLQGHVRSIAIAQSGGKGEGRIVLRMDARSRRKGRVAMTWRTCDGDGDRWTDLHVWTSRLTPLSPRQNVVRSSRGPHAIPGMLLEYAPRREGRNVADLVFLFLESATEPTLYRSHSALHSLYSAFAPNSTFCVCSTPTSRVVERSESPLPRLRVLDDDTPTWSARRPMLI